MSIDQSNQDLLTWDPGGKPQVLKALSSVLQALKRNLEESCISSDEMDTPEAARNVREFTKSLFEKHLGEPATETTPQEVEEVLGEQRNDRAKELGHAEKRIAEIISLMTAVEDDSATLEMLTRVRLAIRNSLYQTTLSMNWGRLMEYVANGSAEKRESPTWILTSLQDIQIYATALTEGFCDVLDDKYPYDIPSLI